MKSTCRLSVCLVCIPFVVAGCQCNVTQIADSPAPPSDPDPPAQVWQGERPPTEEDYAVLEVILADLFKQREFVHVDDQSVTHRLILVSEDNARSGIYLSRAQVEVEVDRKKLKIPDDALADMVIRNHAGFKLDRARLPRERIVVDDLVKNEGNWLDKYGFPRDGTGVIGWVQFWLPGYNKRGDIALVRFWFGPSAHGAIGTYLLVKDPGRWRVKACVFSFFA